VSGWRLFLGVAKVARWGVGMSGDSVDLVERPRGGLSLLLADGPGQGAAAKRVSSAVVARTAAYLAEGVRDGAAARMASDVLYASREGKVSCALTILSADLAEGVLLITRSGDAPAAARLMALPPGEVAAEEGAWQTVLHTHAVPPLGFSRFGRPEVSVYPLRPGSILLGMSDGALAGSRGPGDPRLVEGLRRRLRHARPEQAQALEESHGRPRDDITVAVLGVAQVEDPSPRILRLALDMPAGRAYG
jgi:serine phosphatase RsbU (regulator of sigma subunit)